MQIIPFNEPSKWQERITLTGNVFNLRFIWNALNQYWSLNIYNQNYDPIVLGIYVATNYDLTKQFYAVIVGSGISFGDVLCIDYTLGWENISRYEMGQNADLFYFEPGEFVVTA